MVKAKRKKKARPEKKEEKSLVLNAGDDYPSMY